MGRNSKQHHRRQRAAASVTAGAGMTAYQGASHSDLALRDWQPFAGSPDADLLPELDTLTSRSRDLARNDGLMAGGLQTHRDNIVGAVLRLSALPDYRLLGWTPEQAREWGNKVEAHFRSWADTTDCDAARTLDLLGLTVLALGGEMVNGDAVAIPKWLPRPDSPWATRLSLIESDRLQTPPYLEGMARIRRGVEFDRDGAPLAYHFQAAHPGDALYLRGDEVQDLQRWERVGKGQPLTVCNGVTGPEVVAGRYYSKDDCYRLELPKYLQAERAAKRLFNHWATYNVWVQASFIDMLYNLGEGAVRGSTMLGLANAGKLEAACAQMPRWVRGTVNGQSVQLPGLVGRRTTTAELCRDWGRDGHFSVIAIRGLEGGNAQAD